MWRFVNLLAGRCHLLLSLLLLGARRSVCEELPTELKMMSSAHTSCRYQWALGMYGVDCSGIKLIAVPTTLKTSIEVLDASDNKIRGLTNETFVYYTSIKHLYLEDNSIAIIEEGSLSPLTYLETLDLSKNPLTFLPNNIFHLPSLRKLQLSENILINWEIKLSNLQKPIKAPLEYLDISNCMLKDLPDLGILPELQWYNVSYNSLTKISPESFAKTCKVVRTDLSGSLNTIYDKCDIRATIEWLNQNSMNYILEDLSNAPTKGDYDGCPEASYDLSRRLQRQCRSAYSIAPAPHRAPRQTWLTITGCLFGFVVAFMLLLYLMHRMNVALTKKNSKKTISNPKALLNQDYQ